MRPVDPAEPWRAEIVLSLERVRELLATAFPDLEGLPVEVLGEGFDNLAVRAGPWVFRLPRRQLGAELLERENRWLLAHAGRLPLEVPLPQRISEGILGHPFPFAGYREIVGSTACRAGLSEDGRAALAAPIGRFLATLHALPVPREHWGDPTGRSDVPKRGRRAVDRARQLGDVDTSAVERATAAGIAAPRGEATWVHGDLYGRHLVLRDGALAGVIDWGDVHVGDPAIDLSIAWSFLPPRSHGALLEAYGRPVDAHTWARARAVALDYGAVLVAYGRAKNDPAAEALGYLALSIAC